MIRIWLDDERDPKEPYTQSEFGAEGDEFWVKTAMQAIRHLSRGNVVSISLDHDLGPSAGTGLDVAQWIEEQAFHGNLPRLSWSVHSLNPVGARFMTQALSRADVFWNAASK